MKAFAFGVVVGATACFAIVRVTDSNDSSRQSVERVRLADTPVKTESLQQSTCPDSPAPRAESKTIATSPVTARDEPESRAVLASPSEADRKRMLIESFSDKDMSEMCMRAGMLRNQRERERKDAEPKDVGWAYSTEQLMRQHVESKLRPDQYSKLLVDCHTTFCELKAEGTSEEARLLLDKAAKDIANQPWSDVVSTGQSGASESGTWTNTYEWFRPRTEAERRLWRRPRS